MEAGGWREETVGLTLDTWSQFGSLKAGVMSTASLPCHYLSLHALISAPTGPGDTYNDGSAKRRPGASGRSPGAIGGGESRHNKGGRAHSLAGLSDARHAAKTEVACGVNTQTTSGPFSPRDLQATRGLSGVTEVGVEETLVSVCSTR